MATHESSVNYKNLISDLAEMYPFEVAEVVIVELVANSLDAGATRIAVEFDPSSKVLVVEDDGMGMTAIQFEEYHDFAAGLKTRGTGIGFAGVGAKVSFNIANRVITETRGESFVGGSNWHLQSQKRLIWEDWKPQRLKTRGTRVEVHFLPNAPIPYGSSEDLVALLRRHYLPLLDRQFLELYESLRIYPRGLTFVVDGSPLKPGDIKSDLGLTDVRDFYPRRAGKRVGMGVLGLAGSEYCLGQDLCGLLICTYGKVIKAEMFNQFPGTVGPRIVGVVEVRDLVNFLTTSKTDFTRRSKHREFEGLFGPIREEFKAWLSDLGIQPVGITGADEATKLERELRRILEDVPELSEFFGFPSRRLVLGQSAEGSVLASVHDGVEITFPVGGGAKGQGPGPLGPGDEPGETLVEDPEGGTVKAAPISRTARRGPRISFVEATEESGLAWVDGNNVVINTGHPCYKRVSVDVLAKRLHCLFSIAGAVQRYIASDDANADLLFVDKMMAAWGRK